MTTDLHNDELVATQYMFQRDLESQTPMPVTFQVMVSRFYEGRKWSVRRGGACLAKDGEWEIEPIPSDRDDEFYARCRFDSLDEALAIAAKARK